MSNERHNLGHYHAYIVCVHCRSNQVIHIVVERPRSSAGYPGSIMKLVNHRRALNGLLTAACPPMGMSLHAAG